MTSPVIIQQPGTIDDASAAFMKAFVTSRQLAAQRQQLEIEYQKAQSQIGLEGAQAGEARARAAQLEQEMEKAANEEAGARYAAAHAADPNDIGAFSNTLNNVPKEQREPALRHWIGLQQAGSEARKAKTSADQALVDYQNAQRDQRNQAGFEQTVEHYKSLPLTLNTVQQMARDLAVFDPAKAELVSRTLLPSLDGDWRSVVGNDGKWYLYSGKNGALRDTGQNLGPRGENSVSQQATQLAANQVYLALEDAERLERVDPQASKSPVGAEAAQGIASLGAFGMKPFGGIAGPVAQQAMTPNQQQFQADMARLTGNYPSLMKNFRGSNALLDRLAKEWRPPAGSSDQVRASLRRNRLQLMRLVNNMRMGKPMDLTQLPGYKDSLVGAAQEQPSNAPADNNGDFRNQTPQ